MLKLSADVNKPNDAGAKSVGVLPSGFFQALRQLKQWQVLVS